MHPLELVREYYLNCFGESIEKARSRFDQFATELLLELPSLKHPQYCHRLYRVDIMGKRAGESGVLEVNVQPKTVAPGRNVFPATIHLDGPIVWNGIEFRVANDHPVEDQLVSWGLRWLDVTDSRYDDSVRFQQVIHNMTPPRTIEGGYQFSVDFGSAPTEAFDELVAIVASQSPRVSIGSFSYREQTDRVQPRKE